MGNRKVIQTYYSDLNNLSELLLKLVNSYRILIGGADELNKIALSSKSDVKEALKRADKIGDLIDDVIEVLEHSSSNYSEYCDIKTQLLKERLSVEYVYTEIEQDLSFKE
ncbi:hypothetical protein CLHOM_09110 [Clostridium homopropionicum DSM 5847]|uniref:Uncharacterized protein n=1 Tax=Clostridium homopropionicum DSM 5847 TaxID=1121318 RepID=A0A0L6ZCR5_9CLOT|nr:hypothetical protein [Clostridium homopropionicum]KOA20769.1 hypothetical protein CLHOM_09110 [Clostridium homopropionicum DSM 5847]SFF89575.1 hypothetical protein SAMN04488501_10389 [Clostridium homopropionicum]